MKMFKELSIAAVVIGMQTTALCSNNYEDLIAKGYRWVSIDGRTPPSSRVMRNV